MIFDNAAIFYTAKRFVCHSELSEKSPERNIKTSQTECEVPSPDKTPAFCLKGTSTFFDRKMRSRRRPLLFCVPCARLLKGIKNITRRWRNKTSPSVKQVPLSPFPRKRAPRRLLRGGTSRSRSRELSLIVSLVFGAAHCAMQNSRKLRTKCNCSTLVYTPPV